MQARAATRGMSQPQEARNMVIDTTAVAAFDPGARVFHQKFGYGTVTAVEGDKLTIDFEKAGAEERHRPLRHRRRRRAVLSRRNEKRPG